MFVGVMVIDERVFVVIVVVVVVDFLVDEHVGVMNMIEEWEKKWMLKMRLVFKLLLLINVTSCFWREEGISSSTGAGDDKFINTMILPVDINNNSNLSNVVSI